MKKILRILLLILFTATFLVSGWLLLDYFMESREQSGKYDELSGIVDDAREDDGWNIPDKSDLTSEDIYSGDIVSDVKLVTVTNPHTGEDISIISEYAQLYSRNDDFAGWINLPNTKLNYPIVYHPEDVDYYLHRNFDDEYSAHGCIYVREQCDLQTPSDNVTIYGHNMKDGTMFAPLHGYQDKEFWEDNQYIFLDTLTERHIYQVFCVFTTTASVGKGFEYHLFVDAADQAEFDDFVTQCMLRRMYDTGITAEYGDKLITLSTCEYSQTNGRLVIVAKRII